MARSPEKVIRDRLVCRVRDDATYRAEARFQLNQLVLKNVKELHGGTTGASRSEDSVHHNRSH